MKHNIAIIGLGLIGGSIAKTLAAANEKVIAFDKNKKNLQQAFREKIISPAENIAAAVKNADVIIIAVSPHEFKNVLQSIVKYRKKNAVITDVCSTKVNIIQQAKKILKQNVKYFVPAHPIAGSEKSGWQAARADMFQNRAVILTPLANTVPKAVKIIKDLWQQMGANIITLSAAQHDKQLATTSHLPQILTYIYMNQIFKHKTYPDILKLTGPGFRDFTRLAASPAELWVDITFDNQQAVLGALREFKKYLVQFEKMLRGKKRKETHKIFSNANRAKQISLKKRS